MYEKWYEVHHGKAYYGCTLPVSGPVSEMITCKLWPRHIIDLLILLHKLGLK